MNRDVPLPAPARYFPIENGTYEVAPGLKPLGASFGNGALDEKVFQIDAEFERYRRNKLDCRAERLGKYCLTKELDRATEQAVDRFLIGKLSTEYPQWFHWDEGARTLQCRLTLETLVFDPDLRLKETRAEHPISPPYATAFDALCSQIQEDIAVLRVAPDKRNWLSALHLCSPSHWSGEDKLGKDFIGIHAPVPGIEKVNRSATQLVDAMVNKGPFVRFVWVLASNRRLNYHPVPPPGIAKDQWHRTLRPEQGFFLRVERQVVWGLPEVSASIFSIRVTFLDGKDILADPKRRGALRSAVLSMSPESRVYKGVANCFDELMRQLDSSG